MERKVKTFRIRLKDYKALRSVFPAVYGESVADYFERIMKFLKSRDYKNYAGVVKTK